MAKHRCDLFRSPTSTTWLQFQHFYTLVHLFPGLRTCKPRDTPVVPDSKLQYSFGGSVKIPLADSVIYSLAIAIRLSEVSADHAGDIERVLKVCLSSQQRRRKQKVPWCGAEWIPRPLSLHPTAQLTDNSWQSISLIASDHVSVSYYCYRCCNRCCYFQEIRISGGGLFRPGGPTSSNCELKGSTSNNIMHMRVTDVHLMYLCNKILRCYWFSVKTTCS